MRTCWRRSARLLALLGLMQSRPDWTGAGAGRAARRHRPDRPQGRRPAAASSATRSTRSAGRSGRYRLGVGASLPPLLLDEDEAVAVAVGLRAPTGIAGHRGDQRAGARQARARAARTVCSARSRRCTRRPRGPGEHRHQRRGPRRRRGRARRPWPRRSATTRRSASTTGRRRRTAGRSSPTGWCRWQRRWYLVARDAHTDTWAPYRVDWLTLQNPGGRRFRAGSRSRVTTRRSCCARSRSPAGRCTAADPRGRVGRGGPRADQPDGRRGRTVDESHCASSPAATASRWSRCGSACSASTSTSRSRRRWSRPCGSRPGGMRRPYRADLGGLLP